MDFKIALEGLEHQDEVISSTASTFSVNLISQIQRTSEKTELDYHLLGQQHPRNITKDIRGR